MQILSVFWRQEAASRRDVLEAMMLDAHIRSSIDATGRGRVVTLSGWADWPYQRDEAALVAGNVQRVFDVEDQVVLTTPTASPADIDHAHRRGAKM